MLFLFAAAAFAEDPTFTGTDKAGPGADDKAVSTASAELGGMFATGNTVSFTLSAGLKGSWQKKHDKLQATIGANFGQGIPDVNGDGHLDQAERDAGRVETAHKIGGEARYDRFLSETVSLYVLAGAYTDPFAGYDLRAHGQIGVSKALVKTDSTTLLGELGADVARELYVEGVDPKAQTIASARVLASLTEKLSENAGFDDTVEVYVNVIDPSDVRVLETASISSKLTTVLSLKASYGLIFDNVPVEGFQKLDQVATVTFVATLL